MIVFRNVMIFAIGILCFQVFSFAAIPMRMLFFPLTGLSRNSSTSWIGEGVSLSLSEQLNGTGLGVISRDERIDLLERNDLPPNADLSRGSMILIAQRASADYIVMGSYQGNEQHLKLSVWALNIKTLALSREMTTSGPLAALPQMENELAWMILSNMSLDKSRSREKFRERSRRESNLAYAYYIQSLETSNEKDQIQLLEKALQAYSTFPNAYFQLGRLYYQNREYANAIPHLLLSANDSNNRIASLFYIGNCYLQEEKNALALQTFSRALAISRRSDILNNLAVARFRSGDIFSAIQSLVEAKAMAPNDSTIALNLAILRHITGNNNAAIDLLEGSLATHQESGMLYFMLGFTLKAIGEKDRAAHAMSKARDLGIQVDSLQRENPQTWIRMILGWTDSPISFSKDSSL
jgi:tetratricopeptide (TPR) repeat protein